MLSRRSELGDFVVADDRFSRVSTWNTNIERDGSHKDPTEVSLLPTFCVGLQIAEELYARA
jgi:hypothetical protein